MASSALTPNKPYYQNMIKRSHNTLQFLIYLALLLFPFPISAALHGRCLIASTSQHPVLSNATQLHLHCFTQWTLTIFSLGLTLPNIDGYYNDELTTDEEFITFTFFIFLVSRIITDDPTKTGPNLLQVLCDLAPGTRNYFAYSFHKLRA